MKSRDRIGAGHPASRPPAIVVPLGRPVGPAATLSGPGLEPLMIRGDESRDSGRSHRIDTSGSGASTRNAAVGQATPSVHPDRRSSGAFGTALPLSGIIRSSLPYERSVP